MKTIRVQLEELLLIRDSPTTTADPHPANRKAEQIKTKIRLLVSEDSTETNRRLLLQISNLATAAYAQRGVSPQEILVNPATVPLAALMLLFLDRYRDGLQAHDGIRTLAFWRIVASSLFLVRPAPGRPGPFSARQKAELKSTYAFARDQALRNGKSTSEACQIGLIASYRGVTPNPLPSILRSREYEAQVKRILKDCGMAPKRRRTKPVEVPV